MKFLVPVGALLALATLAVAAPGSALAGGPPPSQFDGVDIQNRLGRKLDANLPLTNASGETVSLGRFFDGERPVLLTLNYYRCTSLCSVQLNELLKTMIAAGFAPGPEKYRIVTVSFDPSDTADVALGKQDTYRMALAKGLAEEAGDELSEAELAERAKAIDWQFLVAREKSIRELTDEVGYGYRLDTATGQYAHSPVVYALSPEGVIARYLFGISFKPMDFKFALMEASEGRLGSFGDKILLNCFAFDADHGGYTGLAWTLMRIGGAIVLLALGSTMFFAWRRERRRRLATAATHIPPEGRAAAAHVNVRTSI